MYSVFGTCIENVLFYCVGCLCYASMLYLFGVSVSLYVGICVMIVCVCVCVHAQACVGNRNERVEGKSHAFLLRVVGV